MALLITKHYLPQRNHQNWIKILHTTISRPSTISRICSIFTKKWSYSLLRAVEKNPAPTPPGFHLLKPISCNLMKTTMNIGMYIDAICFAKLKNMCAKLVPFSRLNFVRNIIPEMNSFCKMFIENTRKNETKSMEN